VPSLASGSVVTTPRYCVDYVITEYGIASLRGKTLWERADELIGIAHPKFRDELANSM
jgi:4-hydroxybutyrate CoA-transferase